MAGHDLFAGVRHFARRLFDRNLKTLWFSALAISRIYRRLIVLERSLSVATPISIATSFRVAPLEDTEVGAYLALRRDQNAATIHRRLAQGHGCFVVWHQGEIVHAAWTATGRVRIEYLSRDLVLHTGEVFVFDAYTGTAFRGRGASPLRALVQGNHLRAQGYDRVITMVSPENTVGFRPLEKVGTKPVGVIGYVGIGPWRWHFYHRSR